MKRVVWASSVLLVVVGVLAVSGCGKSEASARAGQAATRPKVPVEVATALRADVPVQIRGIARVEAYSTVNVMPQVAGQLTAVQFTDGQDVTAGDRLFEIDRCSFQAALDQALANLARDAAQAKYAAEDFARETELYQEKVATQLEYEQSQANAAATAATVQADQAAAETARINLGYCVIKAPIDGRTGAVLVKPGNVVKANEGALVVINQITPIYVTFSVPEQHLPQIQKYQATGPLTVEATIPQDEGPPEHGELSFVDNQVDRMTGMITLKGTFQNEHRRLWPGQFVNAVLTLTSNVGAVVVPSQAVQNGQSGQYVFVVRPDEAVDMRPVVVGQIGGGRTVIQSGIEAGDTVVTDGQLRLAPGTTVSIKAPAATQAATALGAGQ